MQNRAILHLVKIRVDDDFDYVRYLHWFSPHVVQKIQGFHFKHDQVVAFISALLKYYYLANILHVPREHIVIKNDKFNRPYIVLFDNAGIDIDFNISHSGDHVIMAVVYLARSKISYGKVGVDIEYIPKNIDL